MTVQLGPWSNAVGTRFWNGFFLEGGREEGGLGRKTSGGGFIPNVVCVESKGQFGTLALNGSEEAVDVVVDAGVLWNGERTVYDRRGSIVAAKGAWWGEMAARNFSRRSLHCLENVRVGALDPFIDYEEGLAAMSSTGERERLEDTLRWWQESTETIIGGVRLLWDCNGGFGGVTETALVYLHEENPKTDILSLPIAVTHDMENEHLFARNLAQGVVRVAPHTALTLPLACDSLPLVDGAWEVLSHHTRKPRLQMDVCNALTRGSANMAWTRASIVEPAKPNDALVALESTLNTSLIPMAPYLSPIQEFRFSRHVVATLHPNAQEIDRQLALARAQGKVPIWALFSAPSTQRNAILQMGQSQDIAVWLKHLERDAPNLSHDVRNDLALQRENYDQDLCEEAGDGE